MLRTRLYLSLIAVSACLFMNLKTQADTIYVNQNAAGTNNGNNWTNAYTSLQDAINAAQDYDEIWVAQGTYKPDQGAGITVGDRTASFPLKSNVSIYGGFNGTETQLDQRNWQTNETILSADLNNNDLPNWNNYSENSCHVLSANDVNEFAVIDGFTIKSGWANIEVYPDNVGGGIVIPSDSDPTIRNCLFTLNYGSSGGGACWYSVSSDPTFQNCVFRHNNGAFRGGAIYVRPYGHGYIIDCVFENNFSIGGGGAITIRQADTRVFGCEFYNNRSDNHGGAIHIYQGGNPSIDDCTFYQNTGYYGGGIYAHSTDVSITDCHFIYNNAEQGGGIYNYNAADFLLARCTFLNNGTQTGGAFTAYRGGGFYNAASDCRVQDCFFLGNATTEYGGGMATNSYPEIVNTVFSGNSSVQGGAFHCRNDIPSIYNCTFSNNSGTYGDALFADSGDTIRVYNSILWDGTREVYDTSGLVEIYYSTIKSGWSGTGNNNSDENPMLILPNGPDNIPGTADDDVRICEVSPCINTGSNSLIPTDITQDITGASRILSALVDKGAYETGICGDEENPFPAGDLNFDCGVDLVDLAILAQNWLTYLDPLPY